jgi:hypothetical protein
MQSVFISYARPDAAKAKAIATALERASFDVWFDERISSGSEYSRDIENALKGAAAVVVMWSRHSVESAWVRDEAAEGRDSGRLVPLLLDDARPPIGFRQFQTTDLSNWSGRGQPRQVPEIIAAVTAKAGQPLAEPPVPRSSVRGRPLWLVAGIPASLLALLVLGLYLWFERPRTADPLGKPTFAMRPFTATSGAGDLRDIGAQTRDSVSHALSQSGISIRLLEPGQDSGNAGDFVLSGEVSRNAQKLVATIRLDDPGHGLTVFSRRFEATSEQAADLPERIGAQIAGTLAWAAPLIALETRHPSDPAVTADLFKQLDFLGDPLEQYQAARRAVAKAPDSAFAQVAMAFDTAFAIDELPTEERADAVNEARQAAVRAIALAPEFGDSYGIWCFVHSPVYLAQCEEQLLKGRKIDPDAPFVNAFLARLLRGVGRVDEAVHLTRLSYTHDPYVPTKLGWMLSILDESGDATAADELYRQGIRWWPEWTDFFIESRITGALQRGAWGALPKLEEQTGAAKSLRDYSGSGKLVAALEARSIVGVRAACTDTGNDLVLVRCMLALATVGDADGSYAIADKTFPPRLGRTAAETDRLWLTHPRRGLLEYVTSAAAAPLRRDPRYLALAERTGLLEYWRRGHLPDFCRGPRPEPVCAHLRH